MSNMNKREILCLKKKHEILCLIDSGSKQADLARKFNVNPSVISTINKRRENILMYLVNYQIQEINWENHHLI